LSLGAAREVAIRRWHHMPSLRGRHGVVLLALLSFLTLAGLPAASASARARAATRVHRGRARAHRMPAAGRAPRTARAASPLASAVATRYRALTREALSRYASGGERFYAEGLWQNGDPSCWYCNVGPAVGAAYLSGSDPALRTSAIASLNRAIAEYRQPDGSFAGGSIPGAVFAIMLGLSYIQLEPGLDPATRSLWQESLAGIADHIVAAHDATWYANGNINSSYAAAFYFAWRATGEQKYLGDYNSEIEFVTAPPIPRWAGSGLVITQAPTQPDGRDGRGYLTEGSPSGWDPEYSHLQLDFLSALYSASGDPRVLRLLNLILNQELTRVNTTTFELDALGGSRKNEMIPFTSAALPLLVIDGERPDLAPLLPAAFAKLSGEYAESFRYTEHNFYRGVALWLAPVLLATGNVPSVVPPPGPASAGASVGASSPAARVPAAATRPVAPAAGAKSPAPSPRVLGAGSLISVGSLAVSGLEYAFAAPHALGGGVAARALTAFAVFTCLEACTLSIRPLLVIRAGGAGAPVSLQRFLASTRASVRAQGEFISRVALPANALAAARNGRAVTVRLELTVRTAAGVRQGRSGTFRVAAH
jgi:hypothetical protein